MVSHQIKFFIDHPFLCFRWSAELSVAVISSTLSRRSSLFLPELQIIIIQHLIEHSESDHSDAVPSTSSQRESPTFIDTILSRGKKFVKAYYILIPDWSSNQPPRSQWSGDWYPQYWIQWEPGKYLKRVYPWTFDKCNSIHLFRFVTSRSVTQFQLLIIIILLFLRRRILHHPSPFQEEDIDTLISHLNQREFKEGQHIQRMRNIRVRREIQMEEVTRLHPSLVVNRRVHQLFLRHGNQGIGEKSVVLCSPSIVLVSVCLLVPFSSSLLHSLLYPSSSSLSRFECILLERTNKRVIEKRMVRIFCSFRVPRFACICVYIFHGAWAME